MASISDTGTAKCSIAAAARLTGTSVETLRYYERAGAIVRPGRSAGGHRVYTDDDLAYIRFVRRLRATGMSMRVIADYTAIARAGTSTLAERRALLEAHRDELAGLIGDLQSALATVDRKIDHYIAAEAGIGIDLDCGDEPLPSVSRLGEL